MNRSIVLTFVALLDFWMLKAQNVSFGAERNYDQKSLVVYRDTTRIERLPFGEMPILFDFGGIGCHECVENLKRYGELQRLFKGFIRIYFVVSESKREVQEFVSNNSIAKNAEIPVIAADTTFLKAFPHDVIPYEVWVDRNGKVKAYTENDYVDSSHIADLIYNKKISWPIEGKLRIPANTDMANYLKGSQKQHASEECSMIMSGHLPGAVTSFNIFVDSPENKVVYQYINQSILEIYLNQLGERIRCGYLGCPQLYEFPENDSGPFVFSKGKLYRDDWDRMYSICLEAKFPMSEPEVKRKDLMMSYLNSYLNLEVRVVSRIMAHWVLVAKDSAIQDVSRQLVTGGTSSGERISLFKLEGMLSKNCWGVLFLDSTGLTRQQKEALTISALSENSLSFEGVNEALAPIGYMLQVENRAEKILCFGEKRRADIRMSGILLYHVK